MDFTSNGGSRMEGLFPEACAAFVKPILAFFAQVTMVTRSSTWPKRCTVPRTTRQDSFDFQRVLTRWRWLSRESACERLSLRRRPPELQIMSVACPRFEPAEISISERKLHRARSAYAGLMLSA
jgi:hypothetical protein